MASTEWLEEARTIKKEAQKNKSAEVFMQPIFKGKTLVLKYVNLKLQIKEFDEDTIKLLRQSSVPRYLNNEHYANWGGLVPEVLYVRGVLIKSRKNEKVRRFVALQVYGSKGKPYHNQITSIHLLYARGFYTPIAQSSWMRTDEVSPINLRTRLTAKLDLRLENKDGKALTPIAPIGLALYDCMGWNIKRRSNDSKS